MGHTSRQPPKGGGMPYLSKIGGAPGTCTPDTCEGVTVFKTASSTNRTRSVPKWLPNVDSHHDDPFNRRACYFDIIRESMCSRQDLHLPRSV